MKDKIYDSLSSLDHTDTNEDADEVYEMIEDLELLRVKEFQDLHKEMTNKIQELTDINASYIKRLDDHRDQILSERKARMYINLLRQVQNKLFFCLWEENKNSIDSSIDYHQLANRTKVLKRKELYTTNDGVKLALAVIYGYSNCCSKDLCVEYIGLNNKFHPKTKPIKKVIEDLQELKNIYIKYPKCSNIGGTKVTENNIEETIDQINKHSKIFQ